VKGESEREHHRALYRTHGFTADSHPVTGKRAFEEIDSGLGSLARVKRTEIEPGQILGIGPSVLTMVPPEAEGTENQRPTEGLENMKLELEKTRRELESTRAELIKLQQKTVR